MGGEKIITGEGDALVIIDVQNDFLPGGALGVDEGDEVIQPLNSAIKLFSEKHLLIIATRDWHPADHRSFAVQGGPWPPHCVQDTHGAMFSDELMLPHDVVVVSKGVEVDDDDYSNFHQTNLTEVLRDRHVKRVFTGGLATDYCVRATVIDAIENGFGVYVFADAIRAVNVQPDDGRNAAREMKDKGALFITTGDIR
jgi:nicotinamidase/pyrazinamidase